MLIYKQRYKPRTSREFTKNDLTVYDSADNTALNALTIYGKSEVVDGSIKSAGEGYAVVDLGTLTWTKWEFGYGPVFYTQGITDRANGATNFICSKYPYGNVTGSTIDKAIAGNLSNRNIYIRDNDYTDAAAFKAAMSDILLCYELADPTQGNAIAIKTDNGTGIDGTMAVFETGTPLRNIPDTDVRDVMEWNGSSGEVTKNCAKDRLVDLTWSYDTDNDIFFSSVQQNVKAQSSLCCSKYEYQYTPQSPSAYLQNKHITYYTNNRFYIKDADYTTIEDFVASLANAELVYEIATPTTEQLTTAENASIAGLRTFAPQTHAQNNAQTDMTVDYTIRVPTN